MHGNNKNNDADHHLYQIWDTEKEEVFKFGISADEISEEDDLSGRIRNQLSLFNRIVGYLRFIGKVLLRGIKGRETALEKEDQHISEFEAEKGYRPRGNPDRKSSKQ